VKIEELISLKPLLSVGIFSLVFFIFGCGAVLFLDINNKKDVPSENKLERQSGGDYKFTSPLLDCSYQGGPFALVADNMKNKIENIIKDEISNNKIKSASVYFRDLNNGPVMNINSDEKFTPASLLKVPLMIAYFKEAETDKSIGKKDAL